MKTILFVDDEKGLREIMRKILTEEGFKVVTAAGAKEAITWVKKRPFDLLITDLRMPGQGGRKILDVIEKKQSEIKVIILTGYPLDHDTQGKVAEGRYLHISKPFDNADLVGKLRQLLA